MDWLDLLQSKGLSTVFTKASTLQRSAFFIAQLSHPYMTTGKTIALTRRTFVGKVMSLLLNMLTRLVITFLPRTKRLLISWLQSPSAVILEPPKINLSLFPLVSCCCSITQSHASLCDPINCSTPGLPVHHQLPEFTQTHVHRVGDAIQPSHPLSSPSPPALNLSQHQGLFK